MTRTTASSADKPLTMSSIKNHAILIIVGFFVVNVLTSLVSTSTFNSVAKHDIEDLKDSQTQYNLDEKETKAGLNSLKTETSLNTQSIVYIKEKVDKVEESVKGISNKQDELYQLVLEIKNSKK